MIVRRNADPRIRRRGRGEHLRTAEPQRYEAWLRERQRKGDRDGFAAVLEQIDFHRQDERPQIEAWNREQLEQLGQDAMETLRSLHKRIKRSKRRHFDSLRLWAEQVAGVEAVEAALRPHGEAIYFHEVEATRIADAARQKLADLLALKLSMSWTAEPERGPDWIVYGENRASTHTTQGHGAMRYARLGARGNEAFIRHQGFEARVELERGEPWGPRGAPRYATFRPGEGYVVYVKALAPLDVEILKARQEEWRRRDWRSFYDQVLKGVGE